jgi:predicted nucleic acid-binding protein
VGPEPFILDTSAIFTLIEDEAGAERVDALLRSQEIFLPWIVLLEATYITRQELGEAEAEHRLAHLKRLTATILWEADEPTLLTAARLKSTFQLSLADAIIAAFAMRLDAILVHKDPEYDVLAGQVKLESLPHKTKST